jgi:hypothetical protein
MNQTVYRLNISGCDSLRNGRGGCNPSPTLSGPQAEAVTAGRTGAAMSRSRKPRFNAPRILPTTQADCKRVVYKNRRCFGSDRYRLYETGSSTDGATQGSAIGLSANTTVAGSDNPPPTNMVSTIDQSVGSIRIGMVRPQTTHVPTRSRATPLRLANGWRGPWKTSKSRALA